MTPELIEKVAKAVSDAEDAKDGLEPSWWNSRTEAYRNEFRDAARVAIRVVKDWYFGRSPLENVCESMEKQMLLEASKVVVQDDAEDDLPLTAFSAEEKDAFREQVPVPEADATVNRMYSDLGECD